MNWLESVTFYSEALIVIGVLLLSVGVVGLLKLKLGQRKLLSPKHEPKLSESAHGSQVKEESNATKRKPRTKRDE